MREIVFTTMPGLESVAAAELTEVAGLPTTIAQPGRLVSRVGPAAPAKLIPVLNRRLRGVDRVGLTLAAGEASTLVDIEALVAGADLAADLDVRSTFAVRGFRGGRHEFRSVDLAARAGGAVFDRLVDQTGSRPTVDLAAPDMVLRAEIFDRRFRLWLDSTGDIGLHRRCYRGYAHMASMRPTVANLLLRLAGWRGEALIDPFCGSGTLLIEAAYRARGTEPGQLRGTGWAWQRVPSLAATAGTAGAAPKLDPTPAFCHGRLVGVERFDKHLRGAMQNVGRAGLTARIELRRGLAEELADVLGPRRVGERRFVVTNPPFGRRVGSVRQIARLYRDAAAAFTVAEVERVALIAEHAAAMCEALEQAGFAIAEQRPAVYGRTPVTAFVAAAR